MSLRGARLQAPEKLRQNLLQCQFLRVYGNFTALVFDATISALSIRGLSQRFLWKSVYTWLSLQGAILQPPEINWCKNFFNSSFWGFIDASKPLILKPKLPLYLLGVSRNDFFKIIVNLVEFVRWGFFWGLQPPEKLEAKNSSFWRFTEDLKS